jgi:hypothetical protein
MNELEWMTDGFPTRQIEAFRPRPHLAASSRLKSFTCSAALSGFTEMSQIDLLLRVWRNSNDRLLGENEREICQVVWSDEM